MKPEIFFFFFLLFYLHIKQELNGWSLKYLLVDWTNQSINLRFIKTQLSLFKLGIMRCDWNLWLDACHTPQGKKKTKWKTNIKAFFGHFDQSFHNLAIMFSISKCDISFLESFSELYVLVFFCCFFFLFFLNDFYFFHNT